MGAVAVEPAVPVRARRSPRLPPRARARSNRSRRTVSMPSTSKATATRPRALPAAPSPRCGRRSCDRRRHGSRARRWPHHRGRSRPDPSAAAEELPAHVDVEVVDPRLPGIILIDRYGIRRELHGDLLCFVLLMIGLGRRDSEGRRSSVPGRPDRPTKDLRPFRGRGRRGTLKLPLVGGGTQPMSVRSTSDASTAPTAVGNADPSSTSTASRRSDCWAPRRSEGWRSARAVRRSSCP